MRREHKPWMIHPAIGIGQVATATLAPDPSDRLELAQNESERERDRPEERGGGKGREVRWLRWAGALPEVLTTVQ